MKIRYERQKKGLKVFTKKEYENEAHNYEQNIRPGLKGTDFYEQSYMQRLFGTTKQEFKEDRLFEDNEEIQIRENSFVSILEKLENFNLSDTQDDVKGIAFEQFLGTTFRGDLGQFFTPRTIVDFMTEILDPQEGETICDPTCGSGGFLIKAFEYVREKIEKDIQTQKQKFREDLEGDKFDSLPKSKQVKIVEKIDVMLSALNKELDTNVVGSRMHRLSQSCIFGTDANPRMARTSKMNMIMHGDGHGGVHRHDGLLNVNGIFEERFDVILTNPPFGQSVAKDQYISEADRFTDESLKRSYKKKYGNAYDEALKQIDDHIGDPLLSLYDLGKVSSLTEVLFMERCLKLLKKGGRMGMVLPEGVLNNKKLSAVREYFEGKAKIILICSIPQDVFIAAGATVKPSLVFMRRFTETEEKEFDKCNQEAIQEAKRRHKKEYDSLNSEIDSCTADLKSLSKDLRSERAALRKGNKQTQSHGSVNIRITTIQKRQEELKQKKKDSEKKLKELEKKIKSDATQILKQKFDYNIPIAKIDDAGITTTGAQSKGNQLPNLVKEYREYCNKTNLWDSHIIEYSYSMNPSTGKYCRCINKESEIEL